MSKMFSCPKIVQIFVITHYIYKLFSTCSLSVSYREKRTMQYRSLNCAPKAHRLENCVKFAIDNGLSKHFPRKYWVTDQVRVGIGHFRRPKIFGLRFTPLVPMHWFDLFHDSRKKIGSEWTHCSTQSYTQVRLLRSYYEFIWTYVGFLKLNQFEWYWWLILWKRLLFSSRLKHFLLEINQ